MGRLIIDEKQGTYKLTIRRIELPNGGAVEGFLRYRATKKGYAIDGGITRIGKPALFNGLGVKIDAFGSELLSQHDWGSLVEKFPDEDFNLYLDLQDNTHEELEALAKQIHTDMDLIELGVAKLKESKEFWLVEFNKHCRG